MATKLLETLLGIQTENPETLYQSIPPEVRLIGAVVQHALHEWLLYDGNRDQKLRRLGERARRWIFTRGESAGSFDTYCNLLGVDPQVIRERVTTRKNLAKLIPDAFKRPSTVCS